MAFVNHSREEITAKDVSKELNNLLDLWEKIGEYPFKVQADRISFSKEIIII